MTRLNSNNVVFSFKFYLEELLHDVISVFEIGILQFKSQLNENVIVFIICQAETISL